MFGARGFRVARTLEDSLEKAFDAVGKMPPKISPEQVAMQGNQIKAQDTQARAQAETQAANTKAVTALMDAKSKAEEQAETLALQKGKLALEAANLENEAKFRGIRSTGIESRGAAGLQ